MIDFRPDSITIRLMNGNEEVASKTVTAADGWSWTFTDLPKNENGTEIVYTITEDAVEGYTPDVDGYNITNTHTPEVIDIPVTKIWDDANNQDGKRPTSITVKLLADGKETGKTLSITGRGNSWSGTFEGLPKKADGKDIVYTIEEIEVAEYKSSVNGFEITNTHTPETIEISGTKTWDDGDNQDGIRPDSITVRLWADGTEVASQTVTAESGWTWDFTNLPKYASGEVINYTITEDAVEGYTPAVDGYNITNTHTPETVSVSGSKTWNDNNDQDGIRPDSITVNLLADGVEVKEQTVNAESNWGWSFTELPKYADGKEITYTITEDAVEGYTTVITGNAAEGYTITNTHTPETIEVSGSKTWDDSNNQDGKRPASITINLLADGVKINSVEVTEADGWAWSFENLPKYRDQGAEIVYSVTEDTVEDYSATYNGYDVTNSYTPEKTSITVTKAWDDADNQDGIRPNGVTVVLYADGTATENTLTLSSGNNWTGSFTDLDKYAEGEEILYTVTEEAVEGYTTVITGNAADGYTITNTHTPAVVSVEGSKTWEDNNDQDGARPESITINLLADGEVIETITVTEADGWAWSFADLPKYKEHGSLIAYSVTETAVEGYITSYDGYNVTNTHAPEKTSVTVSKVWADADNQDGIRPADITVTLVANGVATEETLILSSGNNWTGSFTDLDKYAEGEEIVYTVTEEEVEGYTASISGDKTSGYTITNTHTPAVVSVEGSKTWEDNNDQDGARPESITINLLKNGKIEQTKTVTAKDEWKWSFTNLPKNENGKEIVYAISEIAVEGYTTELDGYDVINTHDPEKVSVAVTKRWADSNDQDGIRPDSVTVKLLADGEDTRKTLILNEENLWIGTFTDLDKFANGEEIVYTVEEVPVEGYTTVITGDRVRGFTITNSHTTEVVELRGSKTWDDGNDQDGKRPESITIRLLADGVEVATKTVTEADRWAWSFTGMPKYKDGGTAIVYTISEDHVEGYTAIYSADKLSVTNKYAPKEINITVVKAWADKHNAEGIRPKKITINLLANGKEVASMKLTADDKWSGTFTDLPKYEDGKEIKYTITEDAVRGYKTVIRGNAKNGFTVTNSHTYIPQTGDERSPMLWIGLMLVSMCTFAFPFLSAGKKKRKN